MENSCTLPEDFGNTPKTTLTLPEGMGGLVIHCCCAPCAGAMFECFKAHGLLPTIFFYNPNIHPRDEYERRRDELLGLSEALGFEAVVGDYDTRKWFDLTRGLEHEPERGKRCLKCFTHRLEATALFALERGATHFTSTLATSRWKNKNQVNQAGYGAQRATGGRVRYWDEDWRKEGLVGRRYELVRKFGFYNQEYCGCIYSKENLGHVK